MRERIFGAYAQFRRAASSLQSPFLLLVRLYWGWQFAQSGWGRLHHLPQATQFFSSLHIPFPGANVVFISSLEFVGGILLILGLASRLISLLLACDMMGAYLLSDQEALHSILSDPGKFYNADPYTFLFASLLILIFGPGRFALDWLLRRKQERLVPHPSAA
ncbi:MAG TPA: DoxX family protein [Acidobacteriaceae bacterium]|jgi:putative oxidoreductase